MTIGLATLDRRRAANLRPAPKPLPIDDFARTIKLPDGPAAGQLWDPDSEPAQRMWVDQLKARRFRRFVAVCPSQRGKTLMAILLVWLWVITQLRQSVCYLMPSLDKLTQNWEGKLKPMIEGAGFKDWLPTKGPGSKGGKPAVLTMRDPATGLVAGRCYFMATGTGVRETSVSSATAFAALDDEADDAPSAGAIELAFRRVESFGANSIAIISSTVNDRVDRDDHPVLVIHGQGTRSRLHHRCPHCSGYFPPDFEQMDMATGAIVCPICAVIWSEADRHKALNAALLVAHGQRVQDGQVIGLIPPDCITFSLLTVGTDYHMAEPARIAAEYRAAKVAEGRADFSLMRNHMHKVWCRDYVEPVAKGEFTAEALSQLSERSTVLKRTVPPWAQFLTMAQDVQGNRHYWMVVAHGPDERWAIIDWAYEMLVPEGLERAPTKEDRRRVFNAIRAMADLGWQVEGGESRMFPVQRGVDCGWLTDEVIAWVQGCPEWKAVRGVGEDEVKDHIAGSIEKPLPAAIRATKALRVVKPPGWRVYWHKVDGHVFRRGAHAALLRDADQPGSGLVPVGLKSNDALLLHLTGEIWTVPEEGKREKPYWREVRKRHDWLDCLIYALALALLHRHAPDRRDSGTVGAVQPKPSADAGWVSDFTGGEPWTPGA